MSASYRVRYHPRAFQALRAAARYIAENSGQARATPWLRTLRAGIDQLDTFPRAFPVVGIRRGRTVHSKLVVSHRVFYFIDEPAKTVMVIDVVHTARETKLAQYRDQTT